MAVSFDRSGAEVNPDYTLKSSSLSSGTGLDCNIVTAKKRTEKLFHLPNIMLTFGSRYIASIINDGPCDVTVHNRLFT